MMRTVIVLPTYNEAENIESFLREVLAEVNSFPDFDVEILVVDDYSPDGTSDIVKKTGEENKNIHLYLNNKRGLGNAYIAGFKYAIKNLSPDILIEMDSDFSHDIKKLYPLMKGIEEGYDFVIGSRYVPGGSIPSDWGMLRKMNSKYGNIFARFVGGLYHVKDCTSGYRAIRASLIKQVDLDNLDVKGYAFQMNILFEINRLKGKIKEIPIDFVDRVRGKSKLSIKDVIEFIINSMKLRWRLIRGK